MYKLNHSVVSNPVLSQDRNTITGELPMGQKIVLSRKAKGWDVIFSVVVESAVMHDIVAGKEERECFDALSRRAENERDARHDAHVHDMRKASVCFFRA